MNTPRRLGWIALALLALVGCEPSTPAPTNTPAPGKDASEVKSLPVEPKKEGVSAVKLKDDELAEIKTLPADEQPLALAQGVCPVSKEHLGSMGTPLKQTVNGKTFYLCCGGCERQVKNKPDEVLAELDKLKK
jgi:YHS domain-containing protein